MANRTNTRDRKQAEQYKALSSENAGLAKELAFSRAVVVEKQEVIDELRKMLADRDFTSGLLVEQKQAVEEKLTAVEGELAALQAKMAAARAAVELPPVEKPDPFSSLTDSGSAGAVEPGTELPASQQHGAAQSESESE